jgi:hypothetical protein
VTALGVHVALHGRSDLNTAISSDDTVIAYDAAAPPTNIAFLTRAMASTT